MRAEAALARRQRRTACVRLPLDAPGCSRPGAQHLGVRRRRAQQVYGPGIRRKRPRHFHNHRRSAAREAARAAARAAAVIRKNAAAAAVGRAEPDVCTVLPPVLFKQGQVRCEPKAGEAPVMQGSGVQVKRARGGADLRQRAMCCI